MTRTMSVLVLALAVPQIHAEPLTQGDRDRAMSYLHATRKQFIDLISGVSDAQWNYKPAPDRWSVAEIAEHIVLSDESLFQYLAQILKTPVRPGAKSSIADEKIAKGMIDRSFRAQAPEFLKPTGRWKTKDGLLTDFKKSRDRTIGYIEKTPDDLRGRTVEHPLFDVIDAYQWLLIIPSHSERHMAQIKEVMAAPKYPKK